MFKRPQPKEEWSYEDRRAKELKEAMYNTLISMSDHMVSIMTCEGCASMLPDGADKKLELEEANRHREMLRNCISAYDDDSREMLALDQSKFKVYDQGLSAMTISSHKALHIAWQRAKKKLAGA